MLEGIVQSKSKTFLVFCFCFLLGVATASLLNIRPIDPIILYIALFAIITLLILVWSNKTFRYIVICIVFVCVGIARYSIAFPGESIKEGKHSFVGHISAEPDIRTDGIRYIVQTDDGKIYVKSDLHPRYSYGDRLRISCKIKRPEPIEDFRYDMYLARFGVFATCQEPFITQIGQGRGNALFRSVLGLKEDVATRISLLWHEPQASFMAGLLYGYRGGLGRLNELFAVTGVTHIIAISGYNITIISSILITICVHLRINRKRAFWLITFGIIVFLIFAGLSASVVRAGIMGIIVLLATQMGRRSAVAHVLVLTALLMTLHNPFILVWDAGFQLSFISTLGLIYLAPTVEKMCTWIPMALGLRESVVATLAAIIATLPLILYQFGRLSIVAPMVNVLILWIIPAIMTIGFFSVVSSYIFLPLATILSYFAWAGLEYIIRVVEWFAALPWAAVELRIPALGMISMYCALCMLIKKRKQTPVAFALER